ncbi:lymphocyte antigen 6E-like isoform X1 [Vidua macroura]|uniref:lymphocyte antigen 6E-like isoform X1 n=2 Tax=Vidua macroura TaxID=187451 RepID=UPI0023A8DFB5|nr:lymphocyte antigen 6E-like isoform X1 [Vidua macroura]
MALDNPKIFPCLLSHFPETLSSHSMAVRKYGGCQQARCHPSHALTHSRFCGSAQKGTPVFGSAQLLPRVAMQTGAGLGKKDLMRRRAPRARGPTMKAFLVALLAAVLCAQQASSLFCYICDNEHSNWNCMKTYKCEDHEKYCTTTYSTAGIGKDMGHRITKKCSVDCPETNVNFGVAAYSTKCCSTSLCNFSGANSIRINYAVVLLGIAGSLICVLRVGL